MPCVVSPTLVSLMGYVGVGYAGQSYDLVLP